MGKNTLPLVAQKSRVSTARTTHVIVKDIKVHPYRDCLEEEKPAKEEEKVVREEEILVEMQEMPFDV